MPAVTPSRLSRLLANTLSAIPAVAVVGTAFLYLAGYTYVDAYRRGFGITFGATEMGTAEVIGLGYTVVLVVIFQNFWWILARLLWPFPVAAAVVGIILLGVRRDWRGFRELKAWINSAPTQRLPNYILAACLGLLVLVGALPAGITAARLERESVLKMVAAGCCFTYTNKGGASATGFLLAEGPDRLYVLTPNRVVVSFAPEQMTIVLAPPLRATTN